MISNSELGKGFAAKSLIHDTTSDLVDSAKTWRCKFAVMKTKPAHGRGQRPQSEYQVGDDSCYGANY